MDIERKCCKNLSEIIGEGDGFILLTSLHNDFKSYLIQMMYSYDS